MILKQAKSDMGIVEWQFSNVCNYSCTYCSTKIHKINYPGLKNPEVFINNLKKRLGRKKWLIQLGGYGEPFAIPDFLKIAKKLILSDYYLGIVTNFSFPEKKIAKLCKIAGKKLCYFNASFHSNYADPDEFIQKVKRINLLLNIPIEVSLVLSPKNLDGLAEIANRFKEKGIALTVQLERSNGGYETYTPKQMNKIKKISEVIYGYNIKNNFQGRLCSAGKDYFVLDNDGNAYVCHQYKSLVKKDQKCFREGYLGNILDDSFKLQKKKIICRVDTCFCSTPWRARGWTNLPKKVNESFN